MDLAIRPCLTEEMKDSPTSLLLAYIEDQAVAGIEYTRESDQLKINMVYVKPDFRNLGIATHLTDHITALHSGLEIISCFSK